LEIAVDGVDMIGESLGVKDTSERSHWGREVKELERGGVVVLE
jgi:hypothetical protein